MADWKFVLVGFDGAALGQVTTAREGYRLRYPLNNGVPTLDFALSLQDPAYGDILSELASEGTPQARVYREGSLVFSGRLGGMVEQGNAEDETVRLTFKGPFAHLEHRYAETENALGTDSPSALAEDIIQLADSASDGEDTRLSIGALADGGGSRTLTLQPWEKTLAQHIRELGQGDSGFDFEVLPLEPEDNGGDLGEFRTWAERGSDVSDDVTFEYGPDTRDTVANFRREWYPPITEAAVKGEGDQVQTEAASSAALVSYDKRQQAVSAVEVSDSAQLTARAEELVRSEWIKIVGFKPNPARAPQPWDDYWLGDTVGLRVRVGEVSIDRDVRINRLDVTVRNDLTEDQRVEIEDVS